VQSAGPVYTKDGKEYGKVSGAFRHKWWNYYERGLSYADGEFYEEAQSDLKVAIGQRDKDQRMARTYGMHFIDYFPHRELGIVYYQLGDLRLAKKELELSLSQFPSAKARFYLDRVRKSLIEQEMTEITPPKLTLDFQTQEVWTAGDPVVISGVAEDEQYVAAIKIRGVPLFLEGSKKRIPFSEPLSLSQGTHTIQVVVRNLLGKATKRQLVIHVDREGPLITIDNIRLDETAAESEVVISGYLYDEAGVSAVLVNNIEIPIRQEVEVSFSKRLRADAKVLDLVARDRLGNQTSATISLPSKKSAIRNRQSPFRNRQAEIRNLLLLACADVVANEGLMAGLFGSGDTRPPTIVLKGWTDSQGTHRTQEGERLLQIDRAVAGQLLADHRRDQAGGQHAVGDAAAEDGFLGIVLVEMDRIAVGRDIREHPDIVIRDGLGDLARHADLDILDADRAAKQIVQHGHPQAKQSAVRRP